MEIISVSCSCVRSNFLMLHLCRKCPAYACLLGNTLFLPSLLLTLHLRHIISVLLLNAEDFFYTFLIIPYIKMFAAPLKYECRQSCKCRCVLPVRWGYRSVCRERGVLRHQAFQLWCLLPLALETLSSSQQPLVQCFSKGGYSWAGVQTRLGLRHLGRAACAAWQWTCPSVPALRGLPLRSTGFSARSIPAQAGKSPVQVVVSVAGGHMRVVPCSLPGSEKRRKKLFWRWIPKLGSWQSMHQEPRWSSWLATALVVGS